MTDKWTERLSEYVDGELTTSEAEQLEAHLMECADCGRTLQQLQQVVARAGQVLDREPAQDLWTGIAARIAVAQPEQTVSAPGRRRFSFSASQLVAASIVLMLMSAGSMYMMMKSEAVTPVATSAPPAAGARTPGAVRQVTTNYDAAVTELEGALERNRSRLDTATVRVIEQNLAVIDRAILEARTALGEEPANPYLSKYLDAAMQRKVQLLRRATSVMRAQT